MTPQTHLPQKEYLRISPWIVGLLIVGCCDTMTLPLSRVDGFLNGVAHLYWSGEFKAALQVEQETSVAAFAHLPNLPLVYQTSFSADATYRQSVGQADMDKDGSDETVSVLVIEDGDKTATYFLWSGDQYTLDEGRCYLGFVENGTTYLAAGECDTDYGIMWCEKTDPSTPTCEQCPEAGTCSPCNMDASFENCLPSPPFDAGPGDGNDNDITLPELDLNGKVGFSFDWSTP